MNSELIPNNYEFNQCAVECISSSSCIAAFTQNSICYFEIDQSNFSSQINATICDLNYCELKDCKKYLKIINAVIKNFNLIPSTFKDYKLEGSIFIDLLIEWDLMYEFKVTLFNDSSSSSSVSTIVTNRTIESRINFLSHFP